VRAVDDRVALLELEHGVGRGGPGAEPARGPSPARPEHVPGPEHGEAEVVGEEAGPQLAHRDLDAPAAAGRIERPDDRGGHPLLAEHVPDASGGTVGVDRDDDPPPVAQQAEEALGQRHDVAAERVPGLPGQPAAAGGAERCQPPDVLGPVREHLVGRGEREHVRFVVVGGVAAGDGRLATGRGGVPRGVGEDLGLLAQLDRTVLQQHRVEQREPGVRGQEVRQQRRPVPQQERERLDALEGLAVREAVQRLGQLGPVADPVTARGGGRRRGRARGRGRR
jgi:hypothetical protein